MATRVRTVAATSVEKKMSVGRAWHATWHREEDPHVKARSGLGKKKKIERRT
jgi:hypothetical protein